MHSAIWRLPSQVGGALDEVAEHGGVGDLPTLELICQLDTEPRGQDVKVTCFHPTDGSKAASVVDNKFVIWDLNHGDTAKVTVVCVDMQTDNESGGISLNLKFTSEFYAERFTNFSLILVVELEWFPVVPKNGIRSGP
jgi:hypothetical protein